MTNISSAAAAIAQQSSGSSKTAGATPDNDLVQASFTDVLAQVQAVVTGKPRTGFNSSVTNSLTAQTSAIRNQASSAIDSAIAKTKSLFSTTPKSGFHP